jgi:hypothetical protein
MHLTLPGVHPGASFAQTPPPDGQTSPELGKLDQVCGLLGREMRIMATDPYIPRADEAFRTFAANFAGNILAAPSTYGLTPAEAAHIMDKFVRFDEAYKVVANPDTRTRPSITVKDDARHILQNTISN